MPSRRALLGTVASGTLLGVAGCLGSGVDAPGGTTADTDSSSQSETTTGPPGETTSERPTEETSGPPAETTAPLPTAEEAAPSAVAERGVPRLPTIESETYEPFRGVVVGDRPDSPGNFYETPAVWVWNLTGEPATVAVTVATDDTELHRVETEFPAGAPLAVVFYEPRTYEVAVRVGDRDETVTVGPDRFRCNATATDVRVRPETIESGTISTAAACTTTAGGE
ncbi:hypothetical protein [Halorussus salinus]|uniref:hypothetical protein n=1 Tax=Halorussus salinus TaxID=1364935 RepID=UPI001092D41B|nr:hypothetical protein [Halorussus salinus]